MYKHIISKRSKLKNFAPKILSCAERGVLSIRNANIVSDGKAGLWQKPLSTYLLLAHPSGSWYRLANGIYESVALDTHPPNDIMSDAEASLCQQKKNIKNTRLHSRSCVKTKELHIKYYNVVLYNLVFFFVFSDYGRVLCTNKRLYVRLSRTWFS